MDAMQSAPARLGLESHSSPQAAGFAAADIARIEELVAGQASDCVMILRAGRIVWQRGNTTHRYMCHSIRKSLLSALIGIAVGDGEIDLGATLERLDIDDHLRLSHVERQATVFDLLTARSGIFHPAGYESAWMKMIKEPRHSHPPGTFWLYNNWDFNALGTIYEQVTGRAIHQDFTDRIATPLGMEDWRPSDGEYVEAPESRHRAYPFRLSARDLARFGLLWLNLGRWQDAQVVPHDWVRCSVMPWSVGGASGAYGYMWWVCRDGVHYPNAILPADAYSARGVGGHVLLVVPSLDLVVVHRVDTDQRGREVGALALGRLFQAICRAAG
ncbi:MAG: serine hydrolase [Thalassobaculales bacterium]